MHPGSDSGDEMTGSISGYLLKRKYVTALAALVISLEVPAQLVYPFVWLFIVDVVIGQGRLSMLLPATAVWVSVQVFEQALRIARTFLSERLGLEFSREARVEVHRDLLFSSWRDLESQRTGDLVTRFGPDIDSIEEFLSNRLPNLLIQALGLALIIGALVWINAVLAAIVVIPVVVVALVARRFNSIVGPRYAVAASRLGDMSAAFDEDTAGARTVQALSAEDVRHNRMVAMARQLYSVRVRIVWDRIASENTAGFIGFMGTVGMMSLGAYLVVQGNMTIGGLVAFLGYAWRLPVAVNAIISGVDVWNRAKASSMRLAAVLGGASRTHLDELTPVGSVEGEVKFQVDRFVYPSRTEAALVDVAFTARPGDIVCLVGPSGSGKSTVLNLVSGFYQAENGFVAIDGHVLSESNAHDYRRSMAVVLQDTFIWNDTVEANVRMGVQSASQEDIEEAARLANAHEFIVGLPEGYSTVIGERGVRLSVGQRQRLGIARAFLHNPSIILMDEPTSSVETESEEAVLAAIVTISRHRTTIIASHRTVFSENATSVVRLHAGTMVR